MDNKTRAKELAKAHRAALDELYNPLLDDADRILMQRSGPIVGVRWCGLWIPLLSLTHHHQRRCVYWRLRDEAVRRWQPEEARNKRRHAEQEEIPMKPRRFAQREVRTLRH